MATQRALVYGGRGALGKVIIKTLKAKNIWVCSIDLGPNEDADDNIIVTELSQWEPQAAQVKDRVTEVLSGGKLDAIFCVAGGWAGGNAASKELIKNADMMWKQSVWSSTISAAVAAQHLKDDGILQLTGAVPSLGGTPGMMGYGMAKAAVHQLTKSLAAKDSGLPADVTVATILPITLDTPMNRKNMPDADHSSWTPLEVVAEKICDWINRKEMPRSGSLLKLVTEDGKTKIIPVEE